MGLKNLVLGLAIGAGSVVALAGVSHAQNGQSIHTSAYQKSAAQVYYQTSSPTTVSPVIVQSDMQSAVSSDCGCSGASAVSQPSYVDSGAVSACDGGCSTGGCSTGGRQLGSRLGGIGSCGGGCGASELGDPWTLFGRNCEEPNIRIGGWLQGGYHSENNGLFNSRPDELNLHQAWMFVEKQAVSRNGNLGFGFRFDGMYGQDAGDTQAFGNPTDGLGNPTGWDTEGNFNRGAQYGWAMPQAYIEMAKGDWSVKAGHFYTLIGYEVVTAPDNFFYSHAMTMYNSEPFTHTGAVATYDAGNDTTLYGGWTAGWDTGFDQFGNGSNFLGGISKSLGEYSTMTYMTTFGDFGARGSDAYSHSFVFDTALTDRLQWIAQSDLLRVDSTGEDNVGLNNYLIYSMSDRVALGTRMEWWKGDSLTGYAPHGGVLPATGSHSYYGWTTGLNIKPSANFVIRPEYRHDWSPALGYDQGYFGIDMIALY